MNRKVFQISRKPGCGMKGNTLQQPHHNPLAQDIVICEMFKDAN